LRKDGKQRRTPQAEHKNAIWSVNCLEQVGSNPKLESVRRVPVGGSTLCKGEILEKEKCTGGRLGGKRVPATGRKCKKGGSRRQTPKNKRGGEQKPEGWKSAGRGDEKRQQSGGGRGLGKSMQGPKRGGLTTKTDVRGKNRVPSKGKFREEKH